MFLWVHLYDPHAPYDPPEGFRGADPYRGEIAFADAMLGRLLAAWDARPGRSVVAVTSDHGEAFGEHGEESHGLFVYDTTLRVPLVLRGAGLPAARRVAGRVSLADVAATLAQLAGAEALPGASLVPGATQGSESPADSLYAETLAPRLDFGWSELRSLAAGSLQVHPGAAPRALRPRRRPRRRAATSRTRARRSRRRLSAALDATLRRFGEAESRRGPDPEAAERLRALGYVQGPEGRGSGADPKDRLEVARLIARAVGPFATPRELTLAYAEIARLDPANPLVNFRLADALLREGRTRESVGFFRRVVASEPRSRRSRTWGWPRRSPSSAASPKRSRRWSRRSPWTPRAARRTTTSASSRALRGDGAAARRHYEAARADPLTRERAEARLAALPPAGKP